MGFKSSNLQYNKGQLTSNLLLRRAVSRSFALSNSPSEEASSEKVPEQVSTESSAIKTKGFGKPIPKEIKPKDVNAELYDKQAKKGVPEYNIFLRPMNGSDTEWLPVGSMTIARDIPIGKAVYDVEQALLNGTFKLYPKLKSFYNTRMKEISNKQQQLEDNNSQQTSNEIPPIFEYGYCLKAFPDEPIQIIKKEVASKNFVENW
jgi:hypothetical protein